MQDASSLREDDPAGVASLDDARAEQVEPYISLGWHRMLAQASATSPKRPAIPLIRSGDLLTPHTLSEISAKYNSSQSTIWWRSTFVAASVEAADFRRAAWHLVANSPRAKLERFIQGPGCSLQIEPLGGAIDRTNASTWAHRDAALLMSWICSLRTPKPPGKYRVAGTPRHYPGVETLIERFMADGIASLGIHARGAYQGGLQREAP